MKQQSLTYEADANPYCHIYNKIGWRTNSLFKNTKIVIDKKIKNSTLGFHEKWKLRMKWRSAL